MIDAEILANGAGSGIDRIGRAHHLAVPGDGVLTLQDLQHDGARGHEVDELLVEGLALVHLVEDLRVLPPPPDPLLRYDAQASALEPRDDLPGQIAFRRV